MKEGLKKEEIIFLGQLIRSLGEAEVKLETAYQNKNYDGVQMLKEFILEAQKKIEEVLK
ncbi:MAG: hypothetical protein PVJ67_02370 [Candidatus Pacearchaeota archaeon]|jgi:hypothetical protein